MLRIINCRLFLCAFGAALWASTAFAQNQLGNRLANQAGGANTAAQTRSANGQANSPSNLQNPPQGNAQNGFRQAQPGAGNSANGQAMNQQQGQLQQNPNQPAANQQIPVVPLQNAVEDRLAQVVQQPFPPLGEAEQKYIDTVLDVWEKRTAGINTFECTFQRYVFNAAVDAKDPESIAEGFIRYKNPDKGVFKEDKRVTLAGKKPDGSPDYKENPAAPHGDWWVCDGEWVHNLDRREKKAVRTQLPPQLRGNNIPLSPLPFLFGVKAAEVKARYYVRGLTPPPGSNDVWIEAWPKRADDAGNYSRVQVALDKKDSLPNAMIMFMPNWANNAQNREVFNFAQREVNSNNLLDKIKQNIFMKSFIETNVPNDWNVIQEPWVPPQVQQQVQAAPGTPNGPPVQQATAPAQQQLKR